MYVYPPPPHTHTHSMHTHTHTHTHTVCMHTHPHTPHTHTHTPHHTTPHHHTHTHTPHHTTPHHELFYNGQWALTVWVRCNLFWVCALCCMWPMAMGYELVLLYTHTHTLKHTPVWKQWFEPFPESVNVSQLWWQKWLLLRSRESSRQRWPVTLYISSGRGWRRARVPATWCPVWCTPTCAWSWTTRTRPSPCWGKGRWSSASRYSERRWVHGEVNVCVVFERMCVYVWFVCVCTWAYGYVILSDVTVPVNDVTCVCTNVKVSVSVLLFVFANVCVCVCINVQVSVSVLLFVFANVCVCVCVCVEIKKQNEKQRHALRHARYQAHETEKRCRGRRL